jgi:phage terminase small subunit
MCKRITPQIKLFVTEFLKDFNGTKAAIRAGYSPRTAQEQASRLLSSVIVQEELQRQQETLQKKHGITLDRVVEEYAKIAFLDIRDIAHWGEKGVEFIGSEDISDDAAAAIAEIKSVETTTTFGEDGQTEKVILSVKTHDKKGALDSLCRVLGFNAPEKKELTGKDGGPIQTTQVSLAIEDLKKLEPGELAKRYHAALSQPRET